MQISCSILSSDNRQESIQKLNNTNVDYLHIDVMDGQFVENINFQEKEIEQAIEATNKKVDIHLMVEKPLEYIQKLQTSKVEYITIHEEISKDLHPIINTIKEKKYKVGLSIKPQTNVGKLIPYLKDIDLILVMSVEPGYGKQQFLDSTIKKIEQINTLREPYPNIKLEVDGGIKDTNIALLRKHQVDIVVVGSYITNNTNYQEAINKLKDTN